MFYRVRKTYRPGIFQGRGRLKNYFEGWYFKLADKRTKNIYSVIPGISIPSKLGDSYSFIQIINGRDARSYFFRFDYSDFSYSAKQFEIEIGKNYFSQNRLKLDIDEGPIRADLRFCGIKPWPSSIFSPGTMGWYAFVPWMECYHSVISMDHEIEGYLNFEKSEIDFSQGRGYIEKDWGVSFPQGWIWLQTNHFDLQGFEGKPSSIMLSIARIPWRGRHFKGFLCGLLFDDKFYMFNTYNGSKTISLSYSANHVEAVLVNRDFEITIHAERRNTATLLSPVMGAMEGRISESIDANINVCLKKKNNGETIFASTGCCGGLEIVNPAVLA